MAARKSSLVGTIAFRRNKSGTVELGEAAVTPHGDLRRKGLGSALVRHAIEQISHRWPDTKQVEAFTSRKNDPAARLLLKLGFVEDLTHKGDGRLARRFVFSLGNPPNLHLESAA